MYPQSDAIPDDEAVESVKHVAALINDYPCECAVCCAQREAREHTPDRTARLAEVLRRAIVRSPDPDCECQQRGLRPCGQCDP